VNVGNFRQIDEAFFYSIHLSKLHSNECSILEKRFSQFYALNEQLKLQNF